MLLYRKMWLLAALVIGLSLCPSSATADALSKATRALEAQNFVHGSASTIPPAGGEGIRPRTKSRRDEDAGFTERSAKVGAYSVKLHTKRGNGGALEKEQKKERKWKKLAGKYQKQINDDKDDAAYAANQLQDALNDIWQNPQRQGAGTHCDASGCWSIDTSDETTRATLQAFRDAAGSKSPPPLATVASAAQSAVSATAADVATMDGISATMHAKQRAMQRNRPTWGSSSAVPSGVTADPNDKPLAKNRRERCDSPWRHSSSQYGACAYARRHCRQRSGLFNYQALPYCTFGAYPVVGLAVLGVWLFALAVWLGMAADELLCPCLSVMARLCRMSDNVAGVTFLALGNGAPDIFSQVASAVATPHGAEMALGEVLGSSLIVTCVVLGIIAFVVPFSLGAGEFVRDVLFFLGALLWLFVILLDSAIDIYESAGFILLYSVYIYVVVSGWSLGRMAAVETNPVVKIEEEEDRRQQLLAVSAVTDKEKRAGRGAAGAAYKTTWISQLWDYLNPLDKTAREGSAWEKVVAGVKAPGLLLMRLSSPVVDEKEDKAGWCKPAVLAQLTLCPLILTWCVLLHGFDSLSPAATHLAYAASLVCGAGLATVVHLTSVPDTPPPYQPTLAFLGFVTSVAWIYALAAELVHLLQAIGTMLDVSDTLLGLTVLALANSVGDLVANLAMARAGMPAMAAAACIGAPLVNLLMGVGGATLLGNLLVESPYPFEMNLQLYVSLLFLVFALAAMLVYVYRFGVPVEIGPGLGGVLILVYVAFMVTCLGLEAWGGRKLLTENFGREVRGGMLG